MYAPMPCGYVREVTSCQSCSYHDLSCLILNVHLLSRPVQILKSTNIDGWSAVSLSCLVIQSCMCKYNGGSFVVLFTFF